MKIIVTGSTGLVGTALLERLGPAHAVTRLVRGPAGPDGIPWDPAGGTVDPRALSGADAVVHLAGEGIANRRWSATVKQRIRDSRVAGTRVLAGALAAADRPPSVLVCASAIGYYGDRGEELLHEKSGPGHGFLADVCRAWEDAAAPARDAGIRVAHLRTGVVLSARGGALAQMLPPFKMGVGGILGDGRQYMSWISVEDLTRVIVHAIETPSLAGAVNAVAPSAVTNREFTRTLGRVIRRPTLLPLPAVCARLLFGEMADALLLASARVVPARLQADSFTFTHGGLEGALRAALG